MSDAGARTVSVNLVYTTARLLSGERLTDCTTADDPTCSGGVAAIAAYVRHEAARLQAAGSSSPETDGAGAGAGAGVTRIPTLVVPRFDYESAFVQMHPLGWDAGRLVLHHLLGWKLFVEGGWFLGVEDSQNRDVSGLQSQDWPLLMTNVAVPPTNSWYPYVVGVFFDDETGLAVLNIVKETDGGNNNIYYPQVQSALKMLDYVERVNQRTGCKENKNPYDLYTNRTTEVDDPPPGPGGNGNGNGRRRCWIPVVLSDIDDFPSLLAATAGHAHPPGLIVDLGGRDPTLNPPRLVGTSGSTTTTTWGLSFRKDSDEFQMASLQLNDAGDRIADAAFTAESIEGPLPLELRDATYASDIEALRRYADETISNDPIVGTSTAFPLAKVPPYVTCEAGECAQGNLFTDAVRWAASTDFAFANSGAYHGPGWPAGPVRVSDLWGALPFANTLCVGTMSGLSAFRLLNYSVSGATFSYVNTVDGGKLVQVSGLRVTYNTLLSPTRLVKVEVWNETRGEYRPMERLRMYTFATDSYNCRYNAPFNEFTGELLTIPGEVPGQVLPDLVQEVVASYLSQLSSPYDGSVRGRLVNDTAAPAPLPFLQTELTCSPGTYWLRKYRTCFDCPSTDNVVTLDEMVWFEGVSGSPAVSTDEMPIRNDESFPIELVLKSMPPFLSHEGSITGFDERRPVALEAGGALTLVFGASSRDLDAGTALGEVVIGILLSDGGSYPGCVGNDLTFPAEMLVRPTSELNQLGNIRITGWILAAIAMAMALSFAAWCLRFRKRRVIAKMQPVFLVAICLGVFLIASAIIPLGIDDEIASTSGCDMACMAIPWLLSMGFTVVFSALFSKLWRINQIVSESIRHLHHVTIKEKDVILPFAVLLVLNTAILLTWTIVDPLRWVRVAADGQPWNTYGLCKSKDPGAEAAFFACVGAINAGALFLACYQAYRARGLSDELSEARSIGNALFSLLQLLMIGVPILFLIDETETTARYFVGIVLVFAVSMSLLLFIFVPIFRHQQEAKKKEGGSAVHISGVKTPLGLNRGLNTPHESSKSHSQMERGSIFDDDGNNTPHESSRSSTCYRKQRSFSMP